MVRELHVVAVSEDGRHVLLAGKRGSTKGGFRVALDERLLAAVRGDLPRPGEDPHAAPELSPKEIQARLRAGESAASIALSAGVPVLRVERFSGPVQGEMARIIEATRATHLVRGRLGRSVLPLGAAVDLALSQIPSLRPDSVVWETYRQDEGAWRVTVQWFARARMRSASWTYDPHTKTLVAADPASAALGHHDPDATVVAPRRTPAAAPRKAAPRKAAPKKAAPKKTATKKAAPPARRAAVAKAAPKAAAKPAPTAKKAAPKNVPAKNVPAKKAAAKNVPAKASVRAVPARGRALRVVPDPEPVTSAGRAGTKATTPRTSTDRDGVKTRASVPGWADVLLGTSPGSDR